MVYSWVMLPFIAAFTGWLLNRWAIAMLFRPHTPKKILGLTIQGMLPKRNQAMAGQIARLASAELLSLNEITENFSRPQHLEKLMPYVEEQVDRFLRVKLPEQMPMIGMFIGDKTISQLKDVFINELKLIFPQVMGNYARQLQEDLDLEKIISEKIRPIPPDRMEQIIRSALAAEFRAFGWLGAIFGFVIGWITILFTWFV